MAPVIRGQELGTYPGSRIILGCDVCRRRGEYRTPALVARYGERMSMGLLLYQLPADAGCARARETIESRDLGKAPTCRAVYVADG